MSDTTEDELEYRTLFDRAMDLKNEDKWSDAEEILRDLADRYPDRFPAPRVLGSLLFYSHRPLEAIPHFEHALRIQPKLERASVGLFLSLWKVGRHDDAFEEMKRFVAIAKSEEYTRLIRNMKAEMAQDSK